MKTCTKCKTAKPESEFNHDRRAKDGYMFGCRDCTPQLRVVSNQKNRARIRVMAYKHRLTWKYGITIDDYDVMSAKQDGTCALCKTEDAGRHGKLYVDHDHSTGVFRGLLCYHCNLGLGHFKDDEEALRLAADYLDSTKQVAVNGK